MKHPILVQISPRRYMVITVDSGVAWRQQFKDGIATGKSFAHQNGTIHYQGSYQDCIKWIEDNTESSQCPETEATKYRFP